MWIVWPLVVVIMILTFQGMWIIPEFMPTSVKNWVLMALTLPVVFGPGRQFFSHSWRGLRRGVTDMNLLYATGIGASFLIASINTIWPDAGFGGKKATFFESAAMLTGFIVLGSYLEAITRGRTSEAIRKLMKLQPKVARVAPRRRRDRHPCRRGARWATWSCIRPGESVPVDGVVVEGYSASRRVDDHRGVASRWRRPRAPRSSAAPSTRPGRFRFEATQVGSDTALAQIIRLVEDAQASKAPIQKVADFVAGQLHPGRPPAGASRLPGLVLRRLRAPSSRPETRFILSPYTLAAMGVFGFSLLLSVSVLVISCPCAVGLATPSAMMAGAGKGAEYGVLFKGAEAIEATAKMQHHRLRQDGHHHQRTAGGHRRRCRCSRG